MQTNRDKTALNKMPTVKKSVNEFSFLKPCTLESPNIVLSFSEIKNVLSEINYCFISDFNRYYFISDYVLLNGNRVELKLEVDVLHSFKDRIKTLNVLIDRQEFLQSPFFSDGELPVQCKRIIHFKNFSSTQFNPNGFDGDTNCIALTVNGG